MTSPRVAFMDATETARGVLENDAVAQRWDDDSVLAEFKVSGLAGHLARSALVALRYIEADEPTGAEPIAAADYYPLVVPTSDITDEVNVYVRGRGEETAAGGPTELLKNFVEARDRLEPMLAVESPSRLVRVVDDVVMRLDDYLETRIVETLVHTEDLALSVGIELPEPPVDALEIAIAHLVGVASSRHGGPAVLRALTRRERDDVNALRVL